ncbi:metallopeptidase family protein [Qingshengfaniella alkalisoli]|uniref:Metallopeptidase family protein n=1 Tax=Qingshengfaniella alkalisoli TaxID=2599296 RepID=A0A5B8I9H0_9RHOB|nr:metallopeptidase family protein [Qingshengfaniella alkalisoli]QDY69606.1 metallopeptidase family protein [Qingshengfaniella alkalisoli]
MTDQSDTGLAPSSDDIYTLARAAIEAIPAPHAPAARQIALRVAELADDSMLEELKIDDPFSLTGLYDGIPLTEKSVMDQPMGPDTIWLFRRAILDEWIERGNVSLADLVSHIVVHEVAHHFGWNDEDISRVDQWWL